MLRVPVNFPIIHASVSTLLYIWILVLLWSFNTTADNLPDTEIQALQVFYESTDGGSWNCPLNPDGVPWDFTSSANPCVDDWQGITCTVTATDGYLHVDSIDLQDCNLLGTIPAAITNLTYLTNLVLSQNYLGDNIPVTISELSQLRHLDLALNKYAGPWPLQVFDMVLLEGLILSYNAFTGAMPEAVCNMQNLADFELTSCHLSGTLPACMGDLMDLQTLQLGYTRLYGTIPESFGNLVNLRTLDMSGLRDLTGRIPASFANLTSMEEVYLSYNYLTGPIPNITSWTHMKQFDFSENLLTGTVSDAFCAMPQLFTLLLIGNELQGSLPNCLGNLLSLNMIILGNNHFTGELTFACAPGTTLLQVDFSSNHLHGNLSRAFLGCSTLLSVAVQLNDLTGQLSGVFADLTAVQKIMLGDNALTGEIPPQLLQIPGLYLLRLNGNKLVGKIPPQAFDTPGLWALDFSDNQLTGHLPPSDAIRLSHLFALLLGGNYLSGSIPAEYCDFPHLEALNLTSNHLTGTVPTLLWNTSDLNFLYLSRNLFTGRLPDGFNVSQRLSYFNADSNYLSGPVPATLGNLRRLQSLNLSNNHLSGSLPAEISQLGKLQTLLLQNNAITGTLDHAFNSSVQRNLSTVQFSNNQLTGTLPVQLFRIQSLQVFAAVSNCFEGSIPSEICDCTNLNTLALDGLQSATSCQEGLFSGWFASLEAKGIYIVANPLTGGVPACLFQMPNLTTLHLSGNGLSGSLPSDLPLSASLTDLSLSDNILQGSIPSSILGRKWRNLDLSYNKITHSLSVNESEHFTAETSLSLQQNRLSGDIPGALQGVETISLLESNLFHCSLQRSDLPTHDADRGKYQCGSDSFNDTVYVWLAILFGIISAAGVGVWRYRTQFSEGWRVLRRWWFAGHFVVESPVGGSKNATLLPNYMQMCTLVDVILEMSVICCGYALLVLLPVYIVTTFKFGTYTHQYAWSVSAIYTSGHTAFALLFVFLVLLLVVVVVSFALLTRKRFGAARASTEERGNETVTTTTTRTWRDAAWTALFYLVYIALNFTIVIGVNVAYVIIFLNQNGPVLTLVQILLAIFKVAYNGACAPILMRWLSVKMRKNALKSPKHRLFVQLFVSLVSNILIPCLVVGFISPNCFYDAFRVPEPVTSTFTYPGNCQTFDPASNQLVKCDSQQFLSATTSYNPPFAYSYQCTSSYVSYYSPAYVIMCIIAGFVLPALQMSVLWLHGRAKHGTVWFTAVDAVLPSISKTPSPTASRSEETIEPLKPVASLLVDTNKHITTLLTYLGLVLTFGAVFPPLAVCFTVTLGSIAAFTRLKVGRFLERTREAGVSESSALIEAECVGAGDIAVLRRAVGLLIVLNCLFCMVFLFDTLGDATGLQGAYWVLIVMPLLPVLVFAAYFARRSWFRQGSTDSHSGGRNAAQDPSELEMQNSKDEANPLHLKALQSHA